MATAKYKKGDLDTVEYTPSGAALVVDTIVVLGGVSADKASIGVAMKNVADGVTAEGAVAVTGVFEFPKTSAAVILAGQSVNWDASTASIDDAVAVAASGDLAQFGKAMADGANGETTILIDISESGTFT